MIDNEMRRYDIVDEIEDKLFVDENYFCHIIISSKDHQRSKIFYEKVSDESETGSTKLTLRNLT